MGNKEMESSRRPILVSTTKLRNEPLFRVFRGQLVLKNLCLQHQCVGIDIWNGNAAIQVQPDHEETFTHNVSRSTEEAASSTKATAVLESIEVVSSSGRGIVVMNGAHLHVRDSYIHGCAATGLYVGGVHSRAILETVDVTDNGMGNQRLGGLARGHSGVYIETGTAIVTNCNVSSNSASGITVISPDEAKLTMESSDVILNGISPVDFPVGDRSGLVIGRDCRLSLMGSLQARSSVLVTLSLDENENENE